MNVTLNKTNNVSGVITLSIVEADYQAKVKKDLKLIGERRAIKGFRPGHVPAGVLNKLFGKQVKAEVIDEMVGEELTKYVRENNVKILGEPVMLDESKVDLENGVDFEFKFEIGLSPEISLTIDKNIEIPYYTIEVDEEMYENQNDTFRSRFGKQVKGEVTEEGALIKGSAVELNEDGTVKEGGITVDNTIVSPKYFKSDDEKAKFNDKKVGEDVVFNPWATCEGNATEISSMLNIDREGAADVKADFKLTIAEILVNQKAEMNQEFFDSVLGKDAVANEEEYKAKVKENIAKQLVGDSNYRFTLDAEAVIMKAVGDFDMPDDFLKKYFVRKNENMDEAKIEEEYPKMLPMLKWQIVKEVILENAKLTVEEDDLVNIAKLVVSQQFSQYGIFNAPEDAIEHQAKELVKNQEYRRDFATRALDDKMFAYIKENVKLAEKTVSVADFNALFENK